MLSIWDLFPVNLLWARLSQQFYGNRRERGETGNRKPERGEPRKPLQKNQNGQWDKPESLWATRAKAKEQRVLLGRVLGYLKHLGFGHDIGQLCFLGIVGVTIACPTTCEQWRGLKLLLVPFRFEMCYSVWISSSLLVLIDSFIISSLFDLMSNSILTPISLCCVRTCFLITGPFFTLACFFPFRLFWEKLMCITHIFVLILEWKACTFSFFHIVEEFVSQYSITPFNWSLHDHYLLTEYNSLLCNYFWMYLLFRPGYLDNLFLIGKLVIVNFCPDRDYGR